LRAAAVGKPERLRDEVRRCVDPKRDRYRVDDVARAARRAVVVIADSTDARRWPSPKRVDCAAVPTTTTFDVDTSAHAITICPGVMVYPPATLNRKIGRLFTPSVLHPDDNGCPVGK
jgi:hypothetical protein